MKKIWTAGPLLIALIVWEFASPYIFSDKFSVVVTAADVSRSCSDGRGFFTRKMRSDAPQSDVFGYCGTVMTDHGAFDLVESSSFLFGADKREDIFDALQSKCAVTIRASGAGAKPSLGDLATTGARWTILSLDGPVSCP